MSEDGPRRVLVTGGSGFLGRHVCRALEAQGCHVVAPSHSEYDLVDREAARRMLADHRPEVVVHLAAVVGGIDANRRNPGLFFHDNMAMGLHLVEEARRAAIGRLVVLGTICSYPKFASIPFREEDLWSGYPEETNAPYGIAKKALLVMAQAYRAQYGLETTFLMPVNLYGPGDHFDLRNSHVIPALVRKCVEAADRGDEVVEVWGTGNVTREFLYVEDCASAIAAAVDAPAPEEPVNVGAGFEISIRDLADLVAKASGFSGELRFDPSMPDGQPRRSLDTSRARDLLGWTATTSLEDGLAKTVQWFRRHGCPD